MKKYLNNRLIVIAIVLAIAGCGLTFAFVFRTTGITINRFTVADVSCAVNEVFDSEKGIKTSIKVKNTGNTDAYIRVRLVSNWVDEKGNVIGKSSEEPLFTPDAWLSSDWFKFGENYYYRKPVKAGEITNDIFASGAYLTLKEDSKDMVYQSVEILAEAIQAEPEKAVSRAWNLVAGSDGRLIEPVSPPSP